MKNATMDKKCDKTRTFPRHSNKEQELRRLEELPEITIEPPPE